MTPLCALALKYVTDKNVPNAYTPVYWELFKDRRMNVRNVLEIGIGKTKGFIRRHAASLKMWEEFFPNAQIYGVDIRKDLLIDQGRIMSFHGDQANDASIRAVGDSIAGGIDIGIDDGSHDPDHQISSALVLLPLMAPGGIYIIEDIHHERVFDTLRPLYPIERIGTNEPIGAVLGIIRC
jgi:hypothetical protein